MATEVNARHGGDNDVDEFHGWYEALVVGERSFDKTSAEFLEGEKELDFLDVETNLWPLQNVGHVTFNQNALTILFPK